MPACVPLWRLCLPVQDSLLLYQPPGVSPGLQLEGPVQAVSRTPTGAAGCLKGDHRQNDIRQPPVSLDHARGGHRLRVPVQTLQSDIRQQTRSQTAPQQDPRQVSRGPPGVCHCFGETREARQDGEGLSEVPRQRGRTDSCGTD